MLIVNSYYRFCLCNHNIIIILLMTNIGKLANLSIRLENNLKSSKLKRRKYYTREFQNIFLNNNIIISLPIIFY